MASQTVHSDGATHRAEACNQPRKALVSVGATNQVMISTTKTVMSAVRNGSGQSATHGATVKNSTN